MLSGKIISTEREIVDFATVYLKGTAYGSATNREGIYLLKAPTGTYTLVVSALGFGTFEKKVVIRAGEQTEQNVVLKPVSIRLDEVTVVSTGVSRIKRSAFNALAVDTRNLQNSTKNLSEALAQLPGMKLRESGGVGSDMQLMLDGFSGKHVKVFIDGVPQEGAGTAFDLNNIPAGFAERIEVYKGVVPVGFGTDALGGVINIVTDRKRRHRFLDASYSYGSFNTHRSYVRFGQTFESGLIYEIHAFQNFSDNDYTIDTYVREFTDAGGLKPLDKNKIYRVKRFNDRFHNEAVVGKIGLVDRKWADRFVLGFTYSHYYKEIQTGVYQYVVFGRKHRKGHSLVPSLEYRKRNLFTEGLDVTLAANYDRNVTHHVDTSVYRYNWFGEKRYVGEPGEQSRQQNESGNTNWNGTLTVTYRIGDMHTFTLNQVTSRFERSSRSYIGSSSKLTDFTIPKITRKQVTGFSYRLLPSDKWNFSAFIKYYRQYNRGPVSQNADGIGNYRNLSKKIRSLGYGAAGTWFMPAGLQAKLSYEKAYRLPTTDELFGDDDLEAGKANLKSENSDNFNLNLSYDYRFGKHRIYAEAGLIYRNTGDYIKRGLDTYGGTSYGYYENHGHVKTKGYNLSVRYSYSTWFTAGGTYTDMNTRDYEKYRAGNTLQENLHYRARIPNQPYRFAGFDASFHWCDLFAGGNTLTFGYDGYYQHRFPLYWENIGDAGSKHVVPDQLSHNLSLAYSLKNGRYNFSFECRNLTDEQLFDNFSLQKAGRAFYGKVRVYFGD